MADNDGFHFVDLPNTVLQEVISWSPDGTTANPLLNTCHAGNQQRRDPATAALALMRCPCRDYHAAVASCAASARGGTSAVVQHLLRLVGPSPDSGGPMTAPAPLLHAALCASATAGDEPAIRALMALPQPPDINADNSLALYNALASVVHLGALAALLECGANANGSRTPCRLSAYTAATGSPQLTDVWLLLVQNNCGDEGKDAAMTTAAIQALREADTHALGRLLREGPLIHMWWEPLLYWVACHGALAALTLVLDHGDICERDLHDCLSTAAGHCRLACVALLLTRYMPEGLSLSWLLCSALKAVRGSDIERAARRPARGDLRPVLALLLRRGAAVTAEVRQAAQRAGLTALLAAVADEVAAGVAAPAIEDA